jgi:hypothetical protein
MEPINYLAQVADPFAQATQGLQLGAGMVELQQKQAAMAQQQQRQQLAAQEQARFFTNPNPTMRDAARYASLLTPEQANAFRPFMEGISKEQQQGVLKSTGQLLSALQTNPQVFITQAKEKALAARNSGDEDDATLFEQMADAAADPKRGSSVVFRALVGRTAGIPGAKEMYETFAKGMETADAAAQAPAKLRQELAAAEKAESDAKTALATADNAAAIAKADADLKKAQAKKAGIESLYAERQQIADLRAKNLTAGLTQAQTQQAIATASEKLASIQNQLSALPEAAQKLVNESAQSAAVSKQASSQYTDLAKQLDSLGNSWGALNNLGEWSKSQFGNQDFRTAIQNEYTRLANSAGIKAYKAAGATGGFSDADLNTALQGIPKANANPQIMAQFLRGMAKEQAIAAALDNAKTDWLTQNKGQLGRANKPFIAGDYSVKPGETYADFAERATRDVVKKFTTPAQSSMVQQIPTDTNPRPMAATSSIEAQADAIIRGGR